MVCINSSMWTYLMNPLRLPFMAPSTSFTLYLASIGSHTENPKPPTSWCFPIYCQNPQCSPKFSALIISNILYSGADHFLHHETFFLTGFYVTVLSCVFFHSLPLTHFPCLPLNGGIFPGKNFLFHGFDTMHMVMIPSNATSYPDASGVSDFYVQFLTWHF